MFAIRTRHYLLWTIERILILFLYLLWNIEQAQIHHHHSTSIAAMTVEPKGILISRSTFHFPLTNPAADPSPRPLQHPQQPHHQTHLQSQKTHNPRRFLGRRRLLGLRHRNRNRHGSALINRKPTIPHLLFIPVRTTTYPYFSPSTQRTLSASSIFLFLFCTRIRESIWLPGPVILLSQLCAGPRTQTGKN